MLAESVGRHHIKCERVTYNASKYIKEQLFLNFQTRAKQKTKKPGKFKIIEARLGGNFCPFFYDMPISSTGRSRYKQERSHNHFDEPFFCQVVRVSRFPPFFILRALYADNWRLQGNDPLCKLKKRKPFLKMQKKIYPIWPLKKESFFENPPLLFLLFVNAPKNCSWQYKLWARISGPVFHRVWEK